MYADRYQRAGIKPGALGVALGVNGAIVAALIFSSPMIVKPPETIFEGVNVSLPPDPPPVEPDPEAQIKPRLDPKTFDPPPIERPTASDPTAPSAGFTTPPGPGGAEGGVTGGSGLITDYVPPHLPVLIGPQPDKRFARTLQPAYPPGERRAGKEGRVTVRVLIGIDGRVKQVELVSAASDEFFAATRKQALEKWRFTPATRDGVPEEAWRVMSVSFVLNEEA